MPRLVQTLRLGARGGATAGYPGTVGCSLDVSHNAIDESEALVLASNLFYNSQLRSLSVAHNPIGSKAARAFLRAQVMRKGSGQPEHVR
jgi:hypothetical protein